MRMNVGAKVLMNAWTDDATKTVTFLCIETVSESGRRKNRMRLKVGFRENV